MLDAIDRMDPEGEPAARGVRQKSVNRTVLFVALALGLGGCGADEVETRRAVQTSRPGEATTPTSGTPQSIPVGDAPSPPPLRLRGGGRELTITPWSFCWSGEGMGVCADGRPPDSPPDIGGPGEIEVEFPVPGFEFTATARPHGAECGRAHTVTLERVGTTTYRLRPLGAAGDWDVTLFGRGAKEAASKGDLSATFRWHTPTDGPNEAPHATASIIGGTGSDIRSFGVEVAVHDLRETPRPDRVSATAMVTSSEGASMSIDLERKEIECMAEGSVYFTAPREVGEAAARLGTPPFRYRITLVVDSVSYQATATWPDDVNPECSPCTPLTFTPPLPRLPS